jgi:hypothetical protein
MVKVSNKNIFNIIVIVVMLFGAAFLYNRYTEKVNRQYSRGNYNDIQRFFLDESDLVKNKKPIIWIHVPYEYNARNWSSFGSRSSYDLNQPYLYLCVRSIIKCCDKDFYVCIIDDSSFTKLMPEWNINMCKLSDPILGHMRTLALSKLVYKYGGMNVPISFLCMGNLLEMYNKGTSGHKMFVCENANYHSSSVTRAFYPDCRFFGALKECPQLREFIGYIQELISSDSTAQMDFLGDLNRWCEKNHVNVISGKEVCTKSMNDEVILVDNLMSDQYIELYKNAYGMWIPMDQILKRRNYEWFARLSPEQAVTSNTNLGKYLLLANAPDSHEGVIEPMDNQKGEKWISFWKTPLDAPVWGPMPLDLGDRVPKLAYPQS